MAKTTVSFSLEDDVLKIINDYQKEKKLSSRSAALERLLLAKDTSINEKAIRDIVLSIMNEQNQDQEVKEDSTSLSDETIQKAYDSMPD